MVPGDVKEIRKNPDATRPITTDHCDVEISASADEAFFLPGSVFSATVSIRCTDTFSADNSRSESDSDSSDYARPFPSFPALETLGASSSTEFGDGRVRGASVDFLACELVGKWSGDSSWVKPFSHGSYNRPQVIVKESTTLMDTKESNGSLKRGFSFSSKLGDFDAINISDVSVSATKNQASSSLWRDALDDACSAGKNGSTQSFTGFIFRSHPHIIANRDLVMVDSQVCFRISGLLPEKIPPTFRGTGMRYWYALTVAVAVNGEAPRSFRVPFRVLCSSTHNQQSPGKSLDPPEIPIPIQKPELKVANKFLESESLNVLELHSEQVLHQNVDNLQVALALSFNGRLTAYRTDEEMWKSDRGEDELLASAEHITAELQKWRKVTGVPDQSKHHALSTDGRNASSSEVPGEILSSRGAHPTASQPPNKSAPVYLISKGSNRILSLHIPRRSHQLGDLLCAVFDFASQQIPCVRIHSWLEMQEVILPSASLDNGGARTNGLVFPRVYAEHEEVVSNTQNTHVMFAIPYDAPVSFQTEAVAVRWFIHFKFFTPSPAALDAMNSRQGAPIHSTNEDNNNHDTSAKLSVRYNQELELSNQDIETLTWSLPILITASDRAHVFESPKVSLKLR